MKTKYIETIDNLLTILNLCKNVSSKYSGLPNAYEICVRGTEIGLKKYQKNQLDKKDAPDLLPYLTWYMKTPLEYAEGIKNKDTEAWESIINSNFN